MIGILHQKDNKWIVRYYNTVLKESLVDDVPVIAPIEVPQEVEVYVSENTAMVEGRQVSFDIVNQEYNEYTNIFCSPIAVINS